jgi:hypothetical protein
MKVDQKENGFLAAYDADIFCFNSYFYPQIRFRNKIPDLALLPKAFRYTRINHFQILKRQISLFFPYVIMRIMFHVLYPSISTNSYPSLRIIMLKFIGP